MAFILFLDAFKCNPALKTSSKWGIFTSVNNPKQATVMKKVKRAWNNDDLSVVVLDQRAWNPPPDGVYIVVEF